MTSDPSRPAFHDIPNNTDKTWWKDPSLRLNVLCCLGCMLCPFYLGYDQSLLNSFQSQPQWMEYFDSPSGDWLGLISACIFFPAIFMGFPAAWICNVWGRKPCVVIGSIIIIAGAIWNALSPNTVHFMVSRVILGIGGAMTKIGAPALLQEIAHPRLRATMGHMYFGFYYIGSLTSAILCIIGLYIPNSWAWRLPCMLTIIGPVVVVVILLLGPESPRFLVKKGKDEKALAVLAKYHANNDRNDALVQWELQEIHLSLEQEEFDSKSSYLDFFRTAGNRRRLVVALAISVGVNWVGNGIVSYYLSPVLKTVGVTSPLQLTSITAGLAVWNLIIAETSALNIEKIGRRPLFIWSTIGMILSYTFVTGFSAGFAETKNANLGIAAIPFLFFFYGCYDIAWTPLNYSYCAEIMPFNLRAKGLAIYLSIQNMANAFNQFVNPIALDALAWKYYIVYIAIDCLYVVFIYFFFPETKNLTIEEVSLVFDYGFRNGRSRAVAALESDIQGEALPGDGDDDKKFVEHVESNESGKL